MCVCANQQNENPVSGCVPNTVWQNAGHERARSWFVPQNRREFGGRLRRRIYHDWMFAELQPQYIWTRENDWEPTPVLMLRLQAEFRRQ